MSSETWTKEPSGSIELPRHGWLVRGDNGIAIAWVRLEIDAAAILADHDKAQRLEAALRRIASMATFDDPYFIARAALEDAPVNAKGES